MDWEIPESQSLFRRERDRTSSLYTPFIERLHIRPRSDSDSDSDNAGSEQSGW